MYYYDVSPIYALLLPSAFDLPASSAFYYKLDVLYISAGAQESTLGKQVVDLTFASEALGMPAADGYGWVQFEFGDQIG